MQKFYTSFIKTVEESFTAEYSTEDPDPV